jgi:uncharacterized membrane protein (DUF106 family)
MTASASIPPTPHPNTPKPLIICIVIKIIFFLLAYKDLNKTQTNQTNIYIFYRGVRVGTFFQYQINENKKKKFNLIK